MRHVVKIGPMHLKGVWYGLESTPIPYARFETDDGSGSHSRGPLPLPTRRKSLISCILSSSTTLAPCCSIRPISRAQTVRSEGRSGVVLTSARRRRRSSPPALSSSRCRVPSVRICQGLPRRWRLTPTRPGQAWRGRTPSRPRRRARTASWAWHLRTPCTRGTRRA